VQGGGFFFRGSDLEGEGYSAVAIWVYLAFVLALGLYAAWNIGANDVANAMGTSVGSKALSFRQAVVYAAIFEFCGAVLVGSHVTETVRGGIVDPNRLAVVPEQVVYGMTAALLASAVWLHIATWRGWPVSTTHSIVGAVFGFGLICLGPAAVNWGTMSKIVMSWIISPIAGAVIAFVLFRFVRRFVLATRQPYVATAKVTPYLVACVFFVLSLSVVYKGLKPLGLHKTPVHQALTWAVGVGAVAGFIAKQFVRLPRRPGPIRMPLSAQYKRAERIFAGLQVITACYVAFAHGANDVANSIGPLAAVWAVIKAGEAARTVTVPNWMLLLGGTGIVVGLATYGYKVIETVGRRITRMRPSRGFCAEFAAATTVLTCSKLGLPISTTHTLVGSVIGVGLARGWAALNLSVIRGIVASWFVTLPVTAGIALAAYEVLRLVVPLLAGGPLLGAA